MGLLPAAGGLGAAGGMGALSGLGAALGPLTPIVGPMIQAGKNYRAQVKARDKYASMVQAAARESYIQDTNALGDRYQQEREATRQSVNQIAAESRLAAGSAAAAAAEGGVGGQAIGEMIEGYRRDALLAKDVALRNQYFAGQQIERQATAIRAQNQSRINEAAGQPINQPDYFSMFLSGAGSLLGIASGIGGIAGAGGGKK